jgi:hydroxyacylglutathione hydrolase
MADALTLEEFIKKQESGYQVIDLREPEGFAEEFIPGSLNIVMDDDFLDIAKYFIYKTQKLILVSEPGWEDYSIRKLRAFGYSEIAGYLASGIKPWIEHNKPIDVVISIDADEMALDLKYGKQLYYDIRDNASFEKLHMEEAENIEPIVLIEDPAVIDDDKIICIFCDDGKLSMALISYLKTHKKHNLHHIIGGFEAIRKNSEILMVGKK